MRGIRLAKLGMHQRTGSGSIRTSLALVTVMAAGMLIGTATASAQGSRPLVVDDDSAQCPGAGYTTIQSAIDEAGEGDTVRVCGGVYNENVTVETSVKLVAKVPAAPTIDCLETTDTALPGKLTVITGAVDVAANDVEIDGVAISSPAEGPRTPIGIITHEENSGYLIRRNVFQDTGEFGIELQSSGAKQTVVEKNCLRRNGTEVGVRAGLAAESGALRNAVIRKNILADNFEGISVAGPHPHANISITDNIVRRETVGIFFSGFLSGNVSNNDIDVTGAVPTGAALIVGGGNLGLVVDGNSIVGGLPAISVNRRANDTNPNANIGIVISRNRIQNSGSGINVTFPDTVEDQPNLSHGLIYRNEMTGGTGSGIVVASGNNDNVLVNNRAIDNGRFGIFLAAVPDYPTVSGTVAVGNTLLGNKLADARDDNWGENTWVGNRCVTQLPTDADICSGAPTARIAAASPPSRALTIPRTPAVNTSTWPCLKVPYFEMDPDGTGVWSWVTVVAPDAPPGTYCGS